MPLAFAGQRFVMSTRSLSDRSGRIDGSTLIPFAVPARPTLHLQQSMEAMSTNSLADPGLAQL